MTELERYEKCRDMMASCKTKEQLIVAIKWINLLVKKYGGFEFEFAMNLFTFRGIMIERIGFANDNLTEINW